jgi:hypothetical protein
MPTTRSRLSRSRVSGAGGLTPGQLEDLILGYCFFEEPFMNDEDRRKCWEKNRDYILSLQGKPVQGETFGLNNGVYFDFGFRPSAWWAYDAPEPRRFISCKNNFCPYFSQCKVAQNIPTEAPQCIIRKGEDRKGKSSCDGRFKIECVGFKYHIFLPTQESEKKYLQRHGLLNEAEKRYIGKHSETEILKFTEKEKNEN